MADNKRLANVNLDGTAPTFTTFVKRPETGRLAAAGRLVSGEPSKAGARRRIAQYLQARGSPEERFIRRFLKLTAALL
jgi:hypothetical protein